MSIISIWGTTYRSNLAVSYNHYHYHYHSHSHYHRRRHRDRELRYQEAVSESARAE